MKSTKYLGFVFAFILLSCSGGDDDSPPPVPVPDPPSAAVLVFPLLNSECTTGVDLTDAISEVTFEWQTSANTELYTLSITNLNTSVPQTISTALTSATLGIVKGTPYSWRVTSTNTESQVEAVSQEWLFYNAGSITNYPPFPATIISPESGATEEKNADDELVFSWTGADVENDITGYELFFSETSPDDLASSYSGTESTFSLSGLVSGSVYYWKVITTDALGNTSDSGVFDFKVE